MEINFAKTVMSFTTGRTPLCFNYKTDGHTLKLVNKYKYLRVLFTSMLQWKLYIRSTCSRGLGETWLCKAYFKIGQSWYNTSRL